jgi:hypothetical protein
MSSKPAASTVRDAMPDCPESDPAAWLRAVDPGIDLPERELQLYARYVRVLALLCECAPYVDDDHYVDVIDEVIADACRHYPLVSRKDGDRCELAIGPPRAA